MTTSELKKALAVNVIRYVSGEILAEQLLHDCRQDIAMCYELGKNRAGDIIRDLNKEVGSTIVTNMLRYIL